MSFLSGAVHALGDVVAPVATGVGTAYDYVTPGKGSSTLTNAGKAISDPNQVYTGSLNPISLTSQVLSPNTGGGGSSTFVPASNSTASPVKNSSQSTNTTTQNQLIGGGSGGVGSNVSAINSAYDTLSNYYNGLLGTINPQQQIAQGQTDTQYNDNLQGLTDQYNAANANLDNQQKVVNDSYTRNLQQLGNSIRNTAQGQLNALGVGGAGDSSAAFMLAHALADLQNQNRSYMNQDMNNQLTQIGLNRTADNNQFTDQKKQLDDWKTQQYQNIATQYASLAQQINEKLAGNEQYRQLALANAGAWAANQAQGVDNTLQNSLNSLNQTYQQALAPSVSMGNIPQYQATQVQAPTVAVSGAMNQTTTPTDVMQYINPNAYKDQNQNQFSY